MHTTEDVASSVPQTVCQGIACNLMDCVRTAEMDSLVSPVTLHVLQTVQLIDVTNVGAIAIKDARTDGWEKLVHSENVRKDIGVMRVTRFVQATVQLINVTELVAIVLMVVSLDGWEAIVSYVSSHITSTLMI